MLQFNDMYEGPVFIFHFNFVMIMNITFVTFLYGPILPILFPIAWLQLFVLYTTLRLQLYYSYQKPLFYDS
jgi:hypothetical protein